MLPGLPYDSLLPDALKGRQPAGPAAPGRWRARARPWIGLRLEAWMADNAVGAIRPTQSSSLRHAVRSAPRLRSLQQRQQQLRATPRESSRRPWRCVRRASKRQRGEKRAPCSTMPSNSVSARARCSSAEAPEHAPRIDGDQQFATVGEERLPSSWPATRHWSGRRSADRRAVRPSPPGPSPLCPPKMGMAPRNAALASVVGSPRSFTPSPAGSACRRVRATGSATRHGAGGEVEDERRAVRTRPAKGDRVGAEDRLASARRRHPGMTRRGRQGHQARLGECLDPQPNPPSAEKCTKRFTAIAVWMPLAGLLQQMRQPQPECALGEPAMGVDPQQAGERCRAVPARRRRIPCRPSGWRCSRATARYRGTRIRRAPPPPGYRPPPGLLWASAESVPAQDAHGQLAGPRPASFDHGLLLVRPIP